MKCKCGNTMSAVIHQNYDFSTLAGLPIMLRELRVLRCRKCGEELLDGREIDRALVAVTLKIVTREGRLSAKEARFLRQQLGITQKELAERMGLHTITVAGWESKKVISPQHDHILRAMALAHLVPAANPEQVRSVLSHVRTGSPPKTPRRLVVEKLAS